MPSTAASRPGGALTTRVDRRPQLARRLLLVLALILPLSMLLALGSGAVNLAPGEAWRALLGQADAQANLIVQQLRLPRVLLAAMTGATLAVSGAAMQGLFRNPLADPSLIGVTAGASLGASLLIVLGGGLLPGLPGLTLISLAAFAGGALAVLVVYRLASSESGTSVATMLLAGIAITSLAGAAGSLLEFLADNEHLRRISLWKMGGLDGANFSRLGVAAAVGAAVLVAIPRHATALNTLLLGESEARHLGIDVECRQRSIILWVAVGVGTSVAMVGTIAFVGLVVPHLIRLLTGPDHRVLLPASALAGAILLVLADSLARVVLAPTELPVGIITALIGVPFFISLLRQRQHYGMTP